VRAAKHSPSPPSGGAADARKRLAGPPNGRKRRFKRTTDSKHHGPIAPNVLGRDFCVSEPNRVWVTDVTAIATGKGWLYLAVMLDLFLAESWAGDQRQQRFGLGARSADDRAARAQAGAWTSASL
jgi:transposase InsO family protein